MGHMTGKIICLLIIALVLGCREDATNKLTPDPSLVYFLVGEINANNNETFILPLTNPQDIQAARAYLENGEKKIVLAKISADNKKSYSLNKDLLNNRSWSWHISEFLSFADYSIEIYDGWPSYVEENYEEWVANTRGNGNDGIIGFWNYAIKREVSYDELYSE
jgi:hypothetical protein